MAEPEKKEWKDLSWQEKGVALFLLALLASFVGWCASPSEEDRAACRADISCWGDKHQIEAEVSCRKPLERLAKYDFKWTDDYGNPMFSRWRWVGPLPPNGTLIYIGDRLQLQNGFGAFVAHTYECQYNPDTKEVLRVTAAQGRL